MIRMVCSLLFINGLILFSCWLLWANHPLLLVGIVAVLFGLLIRLIQLQAKKQHQLAMSMHDGLLHLLDSNFSISLDAQRSRYPEIVNLFNLVADKLRRERTHVYQREAMLDKVINQSNILTILVNPDDLVIYANQPAVNWFSSSLKLPGSQFQSSLEQHAPMFLQSLNEKGSAICTFEDQQHQQQSWHISRNELQLQGLPHQLYLFKPITEELDRQELETWKKAIRVISHELNNSLAPISSMCHSGQLIAQQFHSEALDRAFGGISRRVNHLSEFVKSYGKLAKVQAPQRIDTELSGLLRNIQLIYDFDLHTESEKFMVKADPVQLEQVFINLIKNALEANPNEQVLVEVNEDEARIMVQVDDHGPGIAEHIIHQVMLPFFSTKANGTGIGLAISRTIVDAHGGRLMLKNRSEGGLRALVELPKD